MKKNREIITLILFVTLGLAYSTYNTLTREKLLSQETVIIKSIVTKKYKNVGTLGSYVSFKYSFKGIDYKVDFRTSFYRYNVGDTVLIKCSIKDPLVCEIYDSTQAPPPSTLAPRHLSDSVNGEDKSKE